MYMHVTSMKNDGQCLRTQIYWLREEIVKSRGKNHQVQVRGYLNAYARLRKIHWGYGERTQALGAGGGRNSKLKFHFSAWVVAVQIFPGVHCFCDFSVHPQSVLCIDVRFRGPHGWPAGTSGRARKGALSTAAASRSPCPTNKTDRLPRRSRAHLEMLLPAPSKPSSKASKLDLEAFSSGAG